jgi:hypothetical protein
LLEMNFNTFLFAGPSLFLHQHFYSLRPFSDL